VRFSSWSFESFGWHFATSLCKGSYYLFKVMLLGGIVKYLRKIYVIMTRKG